MAEECYQVTMGRVVLGTYRSMEAAEAVAEASANRAGYSLSWLKYHGGQTGTSSLGGRAAFEVADYHIKSVPCKDYGSSKPLD